MSHCKEISMVFMTVLEDCFIVYLPSPVPVNQESGKELRTSPNDFFLSWGGKTNSSEFKKRDEIVLPHF